MFVCFWFLFVFGFLLVFVCFWFFVGFCLFFTCRNNSYPINFRLRVRIIKTYHFGRIGRCRRCRGRCRRWPCHSIGGGGLTRRIRELGCGGDFWRECESDKMGKRSVCDKSQEGEQTGAEVLGGGGGPKYRGDCP